MTAGNEGAKESSHATFGFLHDDEFSQLLRVAQAEAGLDVEFVEKDYLVTHVLWWLHHEGFVVSFKGGTSLAKCFGLIQRFSEDFDVHLLAPATMEVPLVPCWTPSGTAHSEDRLAYFEWLAHALKRTPGITAVRHDVSRHAPRHLNAVYYLEYHSKFPNTSISLQKSVQLEIAPDTIYALVPQPATSLVHDALSSKLLAAYINNRPKTLSCAHPVATLLGKLDAICNQHARASHPLRYMRHFDDAYHIITAIPTLPPLPDGMTVQVLASRMRADKQIRRSYDANDTAFTLPDAVVDQAALETAHTGPPHAHRLAPPRRYRNRGVPWCHGPSRGHHARV